MAIFIVEQNHPGVLFNLEQLRAHVLQWITADDGRTNRLIGMFHDSVQINKVNKNSFLFRLTLLNSFVLFEKLVCPILRPNSRNLLTMKLKRLLKSLIATRAKMTPI